MINAVMSPSDSPFVGSANSDNPPVRSTRRRYKHICGRRPSATLQGPAVVLNLAARRHVQLAAGCRCRQRQQVSWVDRASDLIDRV